MSESGKNVEQRDVFSLQKKLWRQDDQKPFITTGRHKLHTFSARKNTQRWTLVCTLVNNPVITFREKKNILMGENEPSNT